MSRDGLVRIPDEVQGQSHARITAIVIVTLFLLVTAGTGLVDSLWPLPFPKLMGEEKLLDRRLRERVRFSDGTAARLVERNCRLRSRIRRLVSQDYTFALFWLLDEAKETVVVGADKWLFLTSRVYPFSDSDHRVAHTAARLAALDRRLSDSGIHLVVAPIPRKSVIYKSYLPRGIDPQPHLDRLFLDELRVRGVHSVDLLTPFTAHAAETLYYRNGAHWTPRAEAIAAEAVCREAGILIPEARRSSEMKVTGREPEDLDILRFLGLELSDTKTLRERRFRRFFADQTVDSYEVFDIETGLVADRSPEGMKRISIFGTSFTALRRFPRFIAHFAGEPVWNRAEPGGNIGRLLFSVLRNTSLVRSPELIILEIPNCQAVREGPSRIAGELFTLLQPTKYATIVEHDQFDLAQRMHEPFQCTHARRRVAALPPGVVAHSADGIVSVRLAGRVSGGTIGIEVNSNYGDVTVPWSPDQSELIVPVLGYAPSTQTRIYTKASESRKASLTLQLHDIQLVTDLNYTTAEAGIIGSITRDGTRWIEEIGFERAVPESSFAALELRLEARGPFSGSVEITVTSSDRTREELIVPVKKIRRRGIIVLNLRALEGAPLASVRVVGGGRSPNSVVKHARIVEKLDYST